MNLEELKRYKPQILALAEKYGVENIRVFGSVARGDAGPNSDIDLLVALKPGIGLWEMGGLWYELNELLATKVDVVPEGWMREGVSVTAYQDAVPL